MSSFTVNGTKYPFLTKDDLTFGELETIVQVGGMSIKELDDGSDPTPLALMAFVLVSMQRVTPETTLDDVRKVGVVVLEASAEEDDADPPSEPAPSGPQPAGS